MGCVGIMFGELVCTWGKRRVVLTVAVLGAGRFTSYSELTAFLKKMANATGITECQSLRNSLTTHALWYLPILISVPTT